MRTKSGEYDSAHKEFWSKEITHISNGSIEPRVKNVWATWLTPPRWIKVEDPVQFSWDRPVRARFSEKSADLSDADTRKEWNSFEHYLRLNNYNTSPTPIATKLKVWDPTDTYDKVYLVDGAGVYYEGSSFGSLSNPTVGLTALEDVSGNGIVATPAHINDLKQRSLKAMLPGIRPYLMSINSLYELKDFKRLPEDLHRLWTFAKFIKERCRRNNIKYVAKRTLRRLTGTSADGYLQAEFNILPLLQDITGFRAALAHLKTELNKLLSLERKALTRHFNAPLEPTAYSYAEATGSVYSNFIPLNGANGQVLGGFQPRRRVFYDYAQFHAEIQYSYYLSDYQKGMAGVLTFLDMIGANINPAIIWNAIPFSFLIDWVVGVNRFIDQYKTWNMEPLTIIRRYLWSIKIQRRTQIDVFTNLNVKNLEKPETRATECTEIAYKRVVGDLTTTEITTSGFSLKEFSLGTALLLSRVR